MDWLLISLLLTATLFSLALAWFVWNRSKTYFAMAFLAMMVALAVWTFSYAMVFAAPDFDQKFFWTRIEYIGIGLIPASWLCLALQYPLLRGRVRSIGRLYLALMVEPLLIQALVWTNESHHLFWSSTTIYVGSFYTNLLLVPGPAFWVHAVYSYLLLLIGTLLLVRVVWRTTGLYRKQITAIGFGAGLPWLGNLLVILGFSPLPHVDITPLLFALSSPLLVWGFFRFRLMDILPIAYSSIVENLQDGVLVLDSFHRIIAVNLAGQKIIGSTSKELIGQSLETLTSQLGGLAEHIQKVVDSKTESQFEAAKGTQYFEIRLSPLIASSGALDGILMIFHDITQHKQAESDLKHRAEEMQALHDTLLDLTTPHEMPVLLHTILERATRLLGAHGGSLYLSDADRQEVHCVVSHSGLFEMGGDPLHFGQGAAGTVAVTGEPLILNNYSDWENRIISPPGVQPVMTLISVPMKWQGQVIGVINIRNLQEEKTFQAHDLELLTFFANQAALAIENARLFESAKQRAQEAETLRETTSVVISTLNLDEAIERILLQLERVVPYDSASVQLLRDGYVEIVGGRGWPNPEKIIGMRFAIPGDNPNTRVIQERQPYILYNSQKEFHTFQEQGFPNNIKTWLGAPLIVHNQVIGMLVVDSVQPDFYKENHARLVGAFADQVAIAIENARLYSLERRRVDESDALRLTLADVSSELEFPNLLDAILKRAIFLLGATGGELGLYDPMQQNLEIVASYEMGRDFAGTHIAVGEGVMGRVAENLEPLTVSHYEEWEGSLKQYRECRLHGVIAAPFLISCSLAGVIEVVDKDPKRRFTASDCRLLKEFANQVAIAVENARLYQAAKEAAERRSVLHKASQEIVAASLNPERIYTAIHQAASRLMPSEAFVISLYNQAEKMIDAVYLVDCSGRAPIQRIPAGQGLSGHVIATGKALYIEDVLAELEGKGKVNVESFHFGSDQEVNSILAVPMWLGEKVIGMLSTQSYKRAAYTAEDQSLLEMLASYAAIALDNSRLFKEVQRLAITDSLTGIYNRRHMFELGQREFTRARRFGRPMAVIMLDIDHFKRVNDEFGHAIGDHVLHNLANRLQETIREVDILGRYGGEEFTIILPETDLKAAQILAERLRKRITEPSPGNGCASVTITASIGVAALGPDAPDLADLVAQADAAMYKAKNAGRNRVAVH
jgi:diguanylate cyclase (GGDEF)-like protein/PAS domain S-box-containing protein